MPCDTAAARRVLRNSLTLIYEILTLIVSTTFLFLYLLMMNVLCMKAENVDQGNCMEFVSIMHAYHNYSKIMQQQSSNGNTISLLDNGKQLKR